MTCINSAWCQDDIIIKGKVVNESGAPIKNASVQIDIHNTRTNSNGFFILKNGNFPAQLTVKGNLYKDFTDILLFPEKWKDTLMVYVVMEGKETQLDEVTINADSKFWVYPRKQANVLDFKVEPDGNIILCCSDEHTYYLRHLNETGDKMYETPIRKHPKQIKQDCGGKFHLIYNDSVYETSIVGQAVGIFSPLPYHKAIGLLDNCSYSDDTSIIIRTYMNQKQYLEYQLITKKTRLSKTLYVSQDRQKSRQLKDYQRENKQTVSEILKESNTNHSDKLSNDRHDLKKARERWSTQQFYDLILLKPIYAPLFELNDSLIIFDHPNDSAIVFTKSGVRIRSFPIAYQYFRGWKSELIPNIEKTAIYARFERDGITSLRKINLVNGKVEEVVQIKDHIYPEHIQIHRDFIYYVYKDYLDLSMHYIFKQHLTNR
ncbi:carboxypeptidase-like regulatory domain-containing protein [Fluviicola chungangensis]|uniref:Carboxypeptidase regulatory-like domain-containing protein n=1 Tax=Fluviicola chungangensis TaxID=2597671 RepID=A0A556MNK1_9FLAO|nr:carboxypeptidase-like regulatory domain-containing protein [Fluviicola chungangensis]TSJ41500.1 carboxypeptidase regulatory-like domain-containing protein [Fluviicola chungangensis]